jgi:hypothetical protein
MEEPKLRLVEQPSILGPDGQPAMDAETKIKADALVAEVGRMTDDKETQGYAAAMIVGYQLYNWAVSYVYGSDKYSNDAKTAFINMVTASMADDSGTPRIFDERVMMRNLRDDVVQFVEGKVKRHAKEIKKAAVVRAFNERKAQKETT